LLVLWLTLLSLFTLVSLQVKYVKRTTYEKQHPGRIARKKLPCKVIHPGGKAVEVVVLRVTPKDTWEGEFEDLEGVEESEIIDSGSVQLNDKQSRKKYDALAVKTRITQDIEDASGGESEEAKSHKSGGGRASDLEHSDDVKGDDDSEAGDAVLGWAASSLLEDFDGGAAGKRTAKAPIAGSTKTVAKPAANPASSRGSAAGPDRSVATPATEVRLGSA
jgi:hypothetical protein